jgi:hypothetical protein
LRPAQAKKFARLHHNGKKLSVVVCACHSSDGGKLKIGELRFMQKNRKVKCYLQNNKSKMIKQ